MARDEKLRIRDAVIVGQDLPYHFILGSPAVEPWELKVLKMRLTPDTEVHTPVAFYIGNLLWKDFLFHYERYPEVQAALAGIKILRYSPPPEKESDNGAAAE